MDTGKNFFWKSKEQNSFEADFSLLQKLGHAPLKQLKRRRCASFTSGQFPNEKKNNFYYRRINIFNRFRQPKQPLLSTDTFKYLATDQYTKRP